MLSLDKAKQLEQCERSIEKGLQTFIEVGEALLQIRDAQLYRQSHNTFEEYCLKKWDISVRQSQRLINASIVVNNLKESDQLVALPTSEYQVRSLAPLPPEQQRQIWEAVATTQEPITGSRVQAMAQELQQEKTNSFSKNREALFTSTSEEWYTPNKVIQPTLAVLKVIDLDPCSNSKEQPTIPANNYYTKEDDGLNQTWKGKVYINPPYGTEIKRWVEKFVYHYEQGDISEAILLLPARTDTKWFNLLREFPRCFVKGRLSFSNSNFSAPFPSVVIYAGQNKKEFKKHFQLLGDVYELF